MFEIGSSLREARSMRGLELDAVQKALRIRRRYLEALESDRFEQLPGEVYARGFLREYAEFLGLDGSLYVEEYNARFAQHEHQFIAAQPSAAPLRRGSARLLLVGAAALLICVAGALVAWKLAGHRGKPAASRPSPAAFSAPAATTRATPAPVAAASEPAAPSRLTLTAARGDCWVGVRIASATGRQLYWRTLRQGQTIHFSLSRPLWVRVGRGANLDATVDGKPLSSLPQVTGELTVS